MSGQVYFYAASDSYSATVGGFQVGKEMKPSPYSLLSSYSRMCGAKVKGLEITEVEERLLCIS